jgi:hypothetical protein
MRRISLERWAAQFDRLLQTLLQSAEILASFFLDCFEAQNLIDTRPARMTKLWHQDAIFRECSPSKDPAGIKDLN